MKARERVAAGLCPKCGNEAAPYYLCGKCRDMERLRRALWAGVKSGDLTEEKRGSKSYWGASDALRRGEQSNVNWARGFELSSDDRRFQPRIGRIRVDVDRTLIDIMQRIGRPCAIEEVYAAWGRLRARRTGPVAGDLASIIAADDKRARRLARNAAVAGAATPSGHPKAAPTESGE